MSTMYILIVDHDASNIESSYDRPYILELAESHVRQRLCDRYRHMLPLKVSEHNFELRLIKVPLASGSATECVLPMQTWADKYYREIKETEISESLSTRDAEWAEYERLRKKFHGAS